MSSLWKGEFPCLLFFWRGAVLILGDFGTRWELTVLRQSERYRIKVVYRARPAVALSDSDSVEGMRVPHGPPYISVLDE